MFGYAGRILRVNLSNKSIRRESSEKYVRQWLGSSGFAVKILYDELRPWVTPYAPTNKMVFSSGPLIGTTAPGACKMNVSTLSPVTGGWGTGSSDSHVGAQLKLAGYDALIVEGRSPLPVYIFIHDDEVEIRDASHLWGMTTWETLSAIRTELSDDTRHIVSIGPAGENLVRGACIIQDRSRAFGRCGSGSVMGSKNLKAVVAKGTKAIQVADPQRFLNAVKKSREMILRSATTEKFRKYGALGGFGRKQEICGINYKNFQECSWPNQEDFEKIDPKKVIDKYQVARLSFPGCPIGCGRILEIADGPYAGVRLDACQLEGIITLTSRFAVVEPTFMIRANGFCNEMGMDIDALGGAISWALECYQRGILTREDTDGLELKWGDEAVILELMKKICYREGFGDILAEGSYRAADIVGRDSAQYAMHIKKQDLYEPCRGAIGWTLGTVTSTRGGGHTTGAPAIETTSGISDAKKASRIFNVESTFEPSDYENKTLMVYHTEVLHRICNSTGICHYNTSWLDLDYIDLPEIAEMYSAATGFEVTVEDLEQTAMRQLNMEKALNLRFTDFDRSDDYPAAREYNEPISSGNMRGWAYDKQKFDSLLDEYYEKHGWDKSTSYPTRQTLEKLGIGYVADDLEKIGKLGEGSNQAH